jgi:hypothetical protein
MEFYIATKLSSFKALTLPFSGKFHQRPQYIAHTSATWKTMTTLFLKELPHEHKKLVAPASSKCSWFGSIDISD